jgi:aminoglycoside phosphotransferase (APT) family kinase protein
MTADERARLTSWLAAQLPHGDDVRIEQLDRVELGHSAETLTLTIGWREDGIDRCEDVVLRVRPPAPGLLEPYDLKRQFDILRGLEATPVRAPAARWYEGTREVLGREFYVMDRLGGRVYERGIPEELRAAPDRLRRMSEAMIEQIAAIHLVDLQATGLGTIGDGRSYLDRELDHWTGEIRRVQQGPLPGLETLLAALRDTQPEPCPTVTLVHGDAKPGNFAFEGPEVSAVFDWEMASLGDPLADVGWADVMWTMPGSFTAAPGSLDADGFVARYEELTGIPVRHREWYRAFQAFKMAVIMLVGAMHVELGLSDDRRLAQMGAAVPFMTRRGLLDLGIDPKTD